MAKAYSMQNMFNLKSKIMKKIFGLVLMFAMLSSISVFAQKISKKEVDKFTGVETWETSSETMYSGFFVSYLANQFKFMIRRVGNDAYSMPANVMMQDIFKFTEDSNVTLLLENKETVKLETIYTGVAEATANYKAYEFNTVFQMTESDVEKLKNHDVTDIRISYFGGHYDRALKENKRGLIKKMLKLFE